MEEDTLARSEAYRLLSAIFAYPDEPLWASIQSEESREAARTLAAAGGGFDKTLGEICEAGRERFVAAHVAIFGHTSGGCDVPPYEAPYGATNLFQEADCTADVAGFYKAFGLESSDTCRERPDHVTVEIEFMRFLTAKEAYALSNEWDDKAQICRDAQRVFLKEHLGRWAPTFLRRIARRAEGEVFESIAKTAAAWIESECRLLDVPVEIEDLRIASFDAPAGVNFSCGIDSGAESCGVGSSEFEATTMPNAPLKDAVE